MKLICFFLYTFIYVLILILTYFIHVNFLKVDVLFYAAIQDVIIACLIFSLPLFCLDKFLIFNSFEKILTITIFTLFGYVLAISIPALIDRSLSFYILEKLMESGVGIRRSKFDDLFIKDFVRQYHMIDVRLTEQLKSGTITIENGCVMLTEKGNYIASFSGNFRHHWLPKERLLNSNYIKSNSNTAYQNVIRSDYLCK